MYSIEFTEKAKSFLMKLQKNESERILKKIYELRENPFRAVKRLQGEKLWRARIGEYRAILDIIITGQKIIVIRIGHRQNVYEY